MQTSMATQRTPPKQRGWSVARTLLMGLLCFGVLYVVAMGVWLQSIPASGRAGNSRRWFETAMQAQIRREYELAQAGLPKLHVDEKAQPPPEATPPPSEVEVLLRQRLLPNITVRRGAYTFTADMSEINRWVQHSSSASAEPSAVSGEQWASLAADALDIPAVEHTKEGSKRVLTPLGKASHGAETHTDADAKRSSQVRDKHVCVMILTGPRQGGKDFVSTTTQRLIDGLSSTQLQQWDFFVYDTEGSAADLGRDVGENRYKADYLKHLIQAVPQPVRVITRQTQFPHTHHSVWPSLLKTFHTPDTCAAWWWPNCSNTAEGCPAPPASVSNPQRMSWEMKRTLDMAWALHTCATVSKHSLTLLLHDDVYASNEWHQKLSAFAQQMSDYHDDAAATRWSFLQLYHADKLDKVWWPEYPDFRADKGQRYPFKCCSQAMLFRSDRLVELSRALVEHVACHDADGLMEEFQRSRGGVYGPSTGVPFVRKQAQRDTASGSGSSNSSSSDHTGRQREGATADGDEQTRPSELSLSEQPQQAEPDAASASASVPFIGYVTNPSLFQHISVMEPGRGATHVSYTWSLE